MVRWECFYGQEFIEIMNQSSVESVTIDTLLFIQLKVLEAEKLWRLIFRSSLLRWSIMCQLFIKIVNNFNNYFLYLPEAQGWIFHKVFFMPSSIQYELSPYCSLAFIRFTPKPMWKPSYLPCPISFRPPHHQYHTSVCNGLDSTWIDRYLFYI